MNDNDIDNLFKGNVKYFEKETDYHFQLLVNKFQNFTNLLISWYNKDDKFIYLKEIWEKYICLEDLKKLILMKKKKSL